MIEGYIESFENSNWEFRLVDFTLTLNQTSGGAIFSGGSDNKYKNKVVRGQIQYQNDVIYFLISHEIPTLMGKAFNLYCYFVVPMEQDKIYGLRIQSEELNYIFDSRQVINNSKFEKDGVAEMKLKSIKDTTTETKIFTYRDNVVSYEFTIYRGFQCRDRHFPIKLYSLLNVTFDGTDDYNWIYNLYQLVLRRFINFLCYRTNIVLEVQLRSEPDKEGLRTPFGLFKAHTNMLSNVDEEERTLQNAYIPYEIIQDHSEKIMQELADNKLYTLHVPRDTPDRRTITPARILLITAAFEWEYDTIFSPAVNPDRTEAQRLISNCIDELIKESSGNGGLKKKLKGYKKGVLQSPVPLSQKIEEALLEFKSILMPYILRNSISIKFKSVDTDATLPQKSDETQPIETAPTNLEEFASEIADLRNTYAHGQIDRTILPKVALDIKIIEWLVYCIQLRKISLSDQQIEEAVAKVFMLHNRNRLN